MGGPTREFFRLLRHGMKSYIDETGCFKLNSSLFDVCWYCDQNIQLFLTKVLSTSMPAIMYDLHYSLSPTSDL